MLLTARRVTPMWRVNDKLQLQPHNMCLISCIWQRYRFINKLHPVPPRMEVCPQSWRVPLPQAGDLLSWMRKPLLDGISLPKGTKFSSVKKRGLCPYPLLSPVTATHTQATSVVKIQFWSWGPERHPWCVWFGWLFPERSFFSWQSSQLAQHGNGRLVGTTAPGVCLGSLEQGNTSVNWVLLSSHDG